MSASHMLLLAGARRAAVDPYFYSVTSLLHGDGTNGGQNNTFLDSSTNNFTITRNGNTTQGSFSPFSQTGWSNYFDGTGDYLTSPNNAAVQLDNSTAFTLECWFYAAAFANQNIFRRIAGSAPFAGYGLATGEGGAATNTLVFYDGGGWRTVLTGLVVGQWYHFAATYEGSGTTLRFFVNGIQQGSALTCPAGILNTGDTFAIGAANAGTNAFTGYISNLRVVKGTAVYTSNFTVPTTPLTAITNTSLLTCQANRFLDASSNAFAITRNGDVSVQPFSPFNPTTPYSTSSIGGSGYFDGSGDYLTLASNTNLAMGSGDFTVEFWIYKAASGTQSILDYASSGGFGCFITDTQITAFITVSTTYPVNAVVPLNSWNHIAFVRSGTTLTTYLNGVSQGTNTTSTNFTSPNTLFIGRNAGAAIEHLNGYLSGLRLIKGSAVTPTLTAPPTAVTNTQLLCNFTNGAIFDNAAVADYETVGNAQISTSVKKYGTGSMAFDGTGDYLVTDAPSTQSYAFGTGDFTIEMWVYFNSVASGSLFEFRPASTNGAYPLIYFSSSGVLTYYANSNPQINSSSVSTGQWYHIALCRSGTSTKMFLNGTQTGSTYTDSSNYLCRANGPLIGVTSSLSSDFLNGYIDDLRISKGIGRYPYNFTPPTAEFPNIGGTVTLTADPYFEYTTLLLPGNGTNGAQNNTFLDSSTNNFTITRNGNTTQGTFSPFSQTGWGNYFDGTGDFLSVANNAALDLGSGDFTIEGWWYFNDTSNQALVSKYTANNGYVVQYHSGNLRMVLGLGASDQVNSFSWTPAVNTWYHIAITRSGTSGRAFVNGTQIGTTLTFTTSNTAASTTLQIGSTHTVSELTRGYVSNFRLVKGTAVYTANFTPPTAPLTAITNTSLLTCQSNRFIDNSTNAFAITRNGDVSVQAFSPFNPTAAWSALTNGGSGYYDGAGDYLRLAYSSALQFTGNFTIEFWAYPLTQASAFAGVFNNYSSWPSSTGVSIFCGHSSAGSTKWAVALFGTFPAIQTSADYIKNAWSHIALVRNGTGSNNITLYVNGVASGTFTSNNTVTGTADYWWVGTTGDAVSTQNFTGYLADFRAVSSAVYTANFTSPSAPLTAVSNTQLLLSSTNAGIYDATSKNDLETVGNAQISTTQSKFGGSSMYFDGTGDYLASASSPLLALGTGDLTVEFWFRASSVGSNQRIVQNTVGGFDSTSYILRINGSSKLEVAFAYPNVSASSSTTIANNTWYHVALVRSGTSVKVYLNGTEEISGTSSGNMSNQYVYVGGYYTVGNTEYFTGYVQDVRITKGIARYTSNFTPPTTAFLTL